MKKIISGILLLISVTITVKAQTAKGTRYVGGTMGLTYHKVRGSYEPDTKKLSFSLAPQYSRFFADEWEAGGHLGYIYRKYEYTANSYSDLRHDFNSNGFSSGIFLRKYLMLSEKVGFRTGPYADYSYSWVDYGDGEDENNFVTDFAAGIDLGIVFFPMKSLGLSARLAQISYSYNNDKSSRDDYFRNKTFDAGLTSQLSLSVFYILGKK